MRARPHGPAVGHGSTRIAGDPALGPSSGHTPWESRRLDASRCENRTLCFREDFYIKPIRLDPSAVWVITESRKANGVVLVQYGMGEIDAEELETQIGTLKRKLAGLD